MNTVAMYDALCTAMSGRVVHAYSTSFSIGIRFLHQRFRGPIHSIYAYVRLADEIVDTFHGQDQRDLLQRFREETRRSMAEGFSLNPVIHGFQRTASASGFGHELIDPFLDSMAVDLDRKLHDARSLDRYIHGSAEVVGLMCLRVFCEGDKRTYDALRPAAERLGAAFQKVNFLRDVRDDQTSLGRVYLAGMEGTDPDPEARSAFEAEITEDLRVALSGIRDLPRGSRFGVYLAYAYYSALLRKIQGFSAGRVRQERIRIGNTSKMRLLTTSFLRHSFNML